MAHILRRFDTRPMLTTCQSNESAKLAAGGIDLSFGLLKAPRHGRDEKNTTAFVEFTSLCLVAILSPKDRKKRTTPVTDISSRAGAGIHLARKETIQTTYDKREHTHHVVLGLRS